MSGQAGTYENELKGLLEPVEPGGLIICRSAGSHGRGDLWVALTARPVVIIEVKATRLKNLSVENREVDGIRQYDELLRLEELGYRVWYAVRRKGKRGKPAEWRFYRPSEAKGAGKKGGNAFLADKGISFDSFVSIEVKGRW